MKILIITIVIILLIIYRATSPKRTEKTLIKNIFRMVDDLISAISRMSRVLKVKNRTKIVWKELIKMHKKENWHFGQFDNEKYIVTTFNLKDEKAQKFRYEVTQNNLKYHTFILESFDDYKTSDIMILASHLNSLLNFGKVSVNTKYNCVEFIH